MIISVDTGNKNMQAYAAYCLVAGQLRLSSLPKVLVIDIGGFTVDYMILRFGQLERSYVDSLEEGIIKLYQKEGDVPLY